MIKEATAALIDHNNLTYEQANAVVNEIMNGETSQVQTAAFLAALSAKGETIEEISACAAAMRDHALPVEYDGDLLEIVGTGGDGAGSFNISTTASLVIAAGGIRWQSMATGRHPPKAVRQTVWKHWGSTSIFPRRNVWSF